MPSLTIVQSRAELADPHVLSDIRDRRSIIDAVYDALVRRDENGAFQPWLAAAWDMQPDCRHWRFRLREGVTCHDGGPLAASDVAASLRRALSPDLPGELGTEGVLRGYLDEMRIEVPDETTLTLVTREPLADLLDLLVDIPIVPERALARLTEAPIGSGPYSLAERLPDGVRLRRHAGWWGEVPALDEVVWRAEPDPARRRQAVLDGNVDLAADPPRAASSPGLWHRPGHLCIIFLFNLFRGPATDRRVRQALHHGLDVPALIRAPDIMASRADALAGPLTARHRGADPATLPYSYDPEKARSLLIEAGHRGGLTLDLDLPARFPDEAVPLAQAIARQWREIGVECRLSVHDDRPGYADRVRSKRIGDLACFDSSPVSTYRVLCEKLDSRRRGPWWLGYANPEVDRLIDRAAATAYEAARITLFRAAFRLIHEDAPWLFLYAPDSVWLTAGSPAVGISYEGRLRPGG